MRPTRAVPPFRPLPAGRRAVTLAVTVALLASVPVPSAAREAAATANPRPTAESPAPWDDAGALPPEARGVCRGEQIGRAIGGVLGLWIGRELFSADGGVLRVVASLGGALAGAWLGGAVGRQVDAGDPDCVGRLLDSVPAGRAVTWADGDLQRALRPGAAVTRDGHTCRPFRAAVRPGDEATADWRESGGLACRQPDGRWTVPGP